MLLIELAVKALQVAEGKPRGIGGLTQHQIADTILDDITRRWGEGRCELRLWWVVTMVI